MKPIVEMIGSARLEHGERGRELDAEHPDACLCGFENYLMCPRFDEGIGSLTITRAGVDLKKIRRCVALALWEHLPPMSVSHETFLGIVDSASIRIEQTLQDAWGIAVLDALNTIPAPEEV